VRVGWTIVSGLAEGIDTVAHTTALELGGRTIAVIGTPISESYPKSNAELQARIAKDFLVVSQVPIERYGHQIWKQNRGFFPERNVTMSALTEATVIVEASNTSGTLIQARAALRQNRARGELRALRRRRRALPSAAMNKLARLLAFGFVPLACGGASVPAPTQPAPPPASTSPPPSAASALAVPPAPRLAEALMAPREPRCGGAPLTVHFINVGQALSVLVDLPDGKHILVDTGDSRPGTQAAHKHMMDVLTSDLGNASIDLLWITHQHADHIGGAQNVLNTFKVKHYVDNGTVPRETEISTVHDEAKHDGVPCAAARGWTELARTSRKAMLDCGPAVVPSSSASYGPARPRSKGSRAPRVPATLRAREGPWRIPTLS